MSKKSVKETVSDATKKIATAATETKAEESANVKKEGDEAKAATKSFFKEVGEFFGAIGKAIAKFFKKLFTKKA